MMVLQSHQHREIKEDKGLTDFIHWTPQEAHEDINHRNLKTSNSYSSGNGMHQKDKDLHYHIVVQIFQILTC